MNKKQKPTKQEKIEQSMQTLPDLRISPFLPIAKINKNSKLYKNFVANNNILERKTSWGKIQIRNRLLTQYHSDVLSGIMALKNKKMFFLENRDVAIFFSIYQLSKQMHLEWGERNKTNLIETILEIRDLVITRWNNQGDLLGTYNIIKDAKYSNKLDMFGIILSKEYINFFVKEITISFPETHKKMREKVKGRGEGLIKATINFFITQQTNQKIELIKLLETIGYPINTDRQIRNAKEILNSNINLLKEFGIEYDKKTKIFTYTEQLNDIKFLPPTTIIATKK